MGNSETDLQNEAEGILAELDLLKLLCRYGDARLVGSVALELIVKPDIDVHLLTDNPDLISTVDAVYHQLLDQPKVGEVRISDFRSERAVKIGIDAYPGVSTVWSIDIWITDDEESTGFRFTENLQRALTPEQREAIIQIKKAFFDRGEQKAGLSKRIYDAVIEQDVRTLEAFEKKYL